MNYIEQAYSTTPSCYLEDLMIVTERQIEQAQGQLEALQVTKNALESVLRNRQSNELRRMPEPPTRL